MKNNENGRSMIEMLGVLAIIGVLSVGGITAFGTMFNRYKINETQIQANAIAAKISAYGSESASYDGLTNVAAIKMGAVPSKAVADADKGELTNLYRGSITISGAPLFNKSTDILAYTITYNNLPKDACAAMASYNWGKESSSLIGVGVGAADSDISKIEATLYKGCDGFKSNGSNAYSVACNKGKTVSIPMPPSSLGSACECKNDTCVLVLKFI